MIHTTPYSHVNGLLDRLLAEMQTILGQKLAGLYLYGSLVTGDYDPETSDVDLLAAVAGELSEAEFVALKTMQDDLVAGQPEWDNRIEIAYLSLDALRTFKKRASPIAIISPGEPFHFKEAGKDWLINWYMVREKGLTLFGATPQTIIEPISKAEFLAAVKAQTLDWRDWIQQDWVGNRPSQAYAILTMCRALYTHDNGEQTSKLKAALWAQDKLPEWANLIQNALLWRQNWREHVENPEATLAETRRFVNDVINRVEGR